MTYTTLKQCKQWLTAEGLELSAHNTPKGRFYLVTNFRGGRCFLGTKAQLIDTMNTGWLRYAY